jgi:protein-S-isoprenylcysteine O-methyltransferase Ste14
VCVLGFYESGVVPAFTLANDHTRIALWLLGAAWILIGALRSVFAPDLGWVARSKNLLVVTYLYRRMAAVYRHTVPAPLRPEERTALLFLAVKAYFLPIMVGFVLGNVQGLLAHLALFRTIPVFSFEWTYYGFLPFLLALMLSIDVLYFTVGYLFESPRFNNVVKSVEPTLLGWVVTLACYPPFNGATTSLVGGYYHEFAYVRDPHLALALQGLALILFAVYLSATMALGMKCSNLTNRGIVTRGPYRYVRHPAYVAKVTAWWLSVLPLVNPVAYVSMVLWTGLYTLRAITEERHLLQDVAYVRYCKQVPYRFIPGLF